MPKVDSHALKQTEKAGLLTLSQLGKGGGGPSAKPCCCLFFFRLPQLFQLVSTGKLCLQQMKLTGIIAIRTYLHTHSFIRPSDPEVGANLTQPDRPLPGGDQEADDTETWRQDSPG